MMQLMSHLIFQLAAISVISSVLRMALPNHNIKKYVVFLTGLVVMLCVFSTVLAFVNTKTNPFLIDETLLVINEQEQRQYTKQEQAIVEVCMGTEIKQDIEQVITDNQFHVHINQVMPYLQGREGEKIEIVKMDVLIDPQSSIDNKELKYIQKYISDKYLIAIDKICYYKGEG